MKATRRRFLSAALGSAAAAGAAAPDGRPPNVLFLLTDDQRWDTLGIAGNRVVQTPNLDWLSRRGARFLNSFVTTSICAVSRASFFTGLYARCHGVHGFQTPLTPELHRYSYPVRLREEAGYRTGFVGKYGVGGAKDVEAAGALYDYFQGFPGQGQYFVEGRAHMTEHLGNQSVEFLDGCSGAQPWCLSVSFKAPHVQDNVPPYFLNDPQFDALHREEVLEPFPHMDGRYYESLPEALKKSENRVRWEARFATPEKWDESVKRYYRLIHGVDVQVGRLLGELENRGMLRNTVVIFTGDHGFYLGERGFAGKWYMHEESIRTPLIVADPRRPETHGTTRREMALNIDIAPTIAGLAGLTQPDSMQGRDLVEVLDGRAGPWRREWFYEHLFENPRIPKSEGVRSERWKYFRFQELQPVHEEMYDLAGDPGEEQNLVGSAGHAAMLERLRRRTEEWIANLESWRIDRAWAEPAGSIDG